MRCGSVLLSYSVPAMLGGAGVRSITVIDSAGIDIVNLELSQLIVGFVSVSALWPFALVLAMLSSTDEYRHIWPDVSGMKPLMKNDVLFCAGVPVVSLFNPDLLRLMTI